MTTNVGVMAMARTIAIDDLGADTSSERDFADTHI